MQIGGTTAIFLMICLTVGDMHHFVITITLVLSCVTFECIFFIVKKICHWKKEIGKRESSRGKEKECTDQKTRRREEKTNGRMESVFRGMYIV